MHVCMYTNVFADSFVFDCYFSTTAGRNNLNDSTGSQEGHKSVFAMGCARSAKGRSRDVKGLGIYHGNPLFFHF